MLSNIIVCETIKYPMYKHLKKDTIEKKILIHLSNPTKGLGIEISQWVGINQLIFHCSNGKNFPI